PVFILPTPGKPQHSAGQFGIYTEVEFRQPSSQVVKHEFSRRKLNCSVFRLNSAVRRATFRPKITRFRKDKSPITVSSRSMIGLLNLTLSDVPCGTTIRVVSRGTTHQLAR